MKRRVFLSLAAAIALSACATSSGARTFTGEWTWQFETSSFRTSDGQGQYWLSAAGPEWDQMVAPIRRSGGGPWGRVSLTVEGELSPEGRYGHMGAYRHELTVTRVLRAELIEASSPPSGS